MTTHRPILYAEDDENDVFFMQRAFKRADIPNPLCVVNDGREAVEYLAGEGGFADRDQHPMPCLVLLDLSMPRLTGHDVLKWIRAQPMTLALPVIVLTSSNQDSDIDRAYAEGANGFLIKPGRPEELVSMVRGIRSYWLEHNRAPRPSATLPPGG